MLIFEKVEKICHSGTNKKIAYGKNGKFTYVPRASLGKIAFFFFFKEKCVKITYLALIKIMSYQPY